ncbi:DUF3888 domain-containing protein [Neobacillus sp. YX16]|uniref:DUF3888 domain-containing protein n=1 Tax=Neobacillus sp. YX16 TaxID=3047874 RepID=UPI0024C29964|nr:DUF3888 domain-containing protein [Neobacillus sp. YX16]WHZ00471.1 DUF3888 domain-containing protein [Neobacillus sp. YX16]
MKMLMFIPSIAIFLMVISPGYTKAENDKYLMSDAFLTTLSPHIGNAVVGRYGELTQYALYDIEIISLERTQNGRTFDFNVVLKVFPFEKAHNYIGADTLTLEVLPSGVNITNYKHEEYK